ncbi:toxin VasX [Providencia manganoxydans]|uniref:toxin VasX n=1 Tax=Providencia manganoxydans TaxID=2923283 RepID=UPI003AF34F0A
MTDNTRSPQLTLEEIERQMVELVNKLAPRNLQADAVVCPCESEHRPVYPVRYAYSNFYWDLRYSQLDTSTTPTLEASQPPTIGQLLNASTVAETRGFSARLLRKGWVYVFEEGKYPTRSKPNDKNDQEQDVDATKGRLLVFEHQVTVSEGGKGGTENFIPYIFTVLKNGHVTLKENGMGNPYLAIPKDVINASVFFSEMKLSNYTLNELNSNPAFRAKLMQKVNFIDYNNNDYCVELNQENLNRLVEDYKEESSKFKLFINDITYSNIPSSFYGDTTTVPDIPQDAVILSNQVKKALDCDEKSALLILKDPVGYQKDILSYYNVVTELHMLYQTYYGYPNKIGQYITEMQNASQNIKNVDDRNKMQKILRESVNQSALDREWKDIHKTFLFFEKHQKIVLSLYESFMTNPRFINENGGLKHYFDYAFSFHERIKKVDVFSTEFFKELNQAFDLYYDLTAPLNHSTQGQRTLDKLYSINGGEEDSLWAGLTAKVIGLASKQSIMNEILLVNDYAEYIEKFINKLVLVCADSIAFAFTKTHTAFSHYDIKNRLINAKGIDYLANKVLPMISAFSSAKVSLNQLVGLSGNELSQWMKQLAHYTEQVKLNPLASKLHKLFDWEQKLQKLGSQTAIKIPKIELKDIKTNKVFVYGKESLQVSSKVFLNGFSMITGLIQIYTLQAMSLSERHNPLKLSPYNFYMGQIIANLFVSSASILKVSQVASTLSETVSSSTLKFFLDKIKLPMLTTEVGTTRMKALGKVAGLVGVVLAARDALEAFHIGNYKQLTANMFIAVGSFLLVFITGGWALLAGLFVLGGFVASQLTSWSHLETLLRHSFWGNERRSNFWDNDRPVTIDKQLEKYIDNFERYEKVGTIELQEFYNLFYTAKMTQEEISGGKIRLSFEFTNFTPGISDIYFHFVTQVGNHSGMATQIKTAHSAYVLNTRKDLLEINQQLKAASDKGHWNPETGIFKFSLEVQSKMVNTYSAFRNENSRMGIEDLYWYYQVNDQLKTPLRYLDWSGDAQENNTIIGFINSENI